MDLNFQKLLLKISLQLSESEKKLKNDTLAEFFKQQANRIAKRIKKYEDSLKPKSSGKRTKSKKKAAKPRSK